MKTLFYLFFLSCSLASFAQTYQVLEVEMTAESKPLVDNDINTKGMEFAPFVSGDKIYFASNREFDLTNFGENNWKKSGYLNVFQADIKGGVSENSKIKNIQLLSHKIQTNNHTGPMSLSPTGDTIFFSQVNANGVKVKKKKPLKPQIYMAVKEGIGWSDPKKLNFCRRDFSFGHPYYDGKSKRLYFASDMGGGKGGKDIYYSELKNGQFTPPKNLKEINSTGDDLFPCVQDETIFFASNRSGGKGGLDIYWKAFGSTDQPKGLDGLNTNSDDFGIYVYPGIKKGFYSSNRPDEKGKTDDDIYFCELEKRTTTRNELAGKFTYRNLDGSASDLKVMVYGEEGDLLFETETDPDGKFKFENIDYDGEYSIKPMSESDLELTLFDKDGNPIADLMTDENGEFTYKKLSFKESSYLSLIPEDMVDFDNNTGHMSAQFVYEAFPGKYPKGMKVNLRDKDGNIEESTYTDERGNFDFRQLDMSKNLLLNMDEVEEGLVLLIFDKSGNVTAQLKSNKDGDFIYRKLDPSISKNLSLLMEEDEQFTLTTQTVSGVFEYNKLKGVNGKDLTVYAYNEEGFKLGEVETDDKGFFRFRNLPVQNNLLFKVDETDEDLQMDDFTLYIFDRYGKKIASLKRGQNGYFIFKPLGFDDGSDLVEKKEDSLNFHMELESKYDVVTVYYGSNQKNVLSKNMSDLSTIAKILKSKPDLQVEINAYADARSSDEYNLELSRERGDWVVSYFKRKGISSNRFVVNAYGEAKLVSQDDALNRRAEIRIY